jgi:uncharacterized protein (DUF58 family)
MTSLLRRVRMRTTIHAHRKVRSVLDGEYGSVHKGRSMDFDDLREYVPGDDIKDLDWKASARHGRPLIKRYIATRQHAVLLVVDTGCTMAALSDAQSTKRDVAVMAAGVFAQLAHRHGDLTGLVAGPVSPSDVRVRNAERIVHVPFGSNDLHIERMLRVIHDAIDAEGEMPRLEVLLEYVARNVRRRTMLVIVTDDIDLTDRHRALLRRLDAQHEILFCTVGDVTMTDPSLRERSLRVVGSGGHVPAYFRQRGRLHADLLALGRRRAAETRATLGRLGIVGTRLAGEADVVPALYELLDRQRHRGHST